MIRLRIESEAALPEIARFVVERGVPLHRLGAERKSLERWFLEVMGDEQRPG
jgi:hypothetical protein